MLFFFYLKDEEYEYRSFQQCGANNHKTRVMQSHYRPGQALRVPGG
jgi:hypothetical protein